MSGASWHGRGLAANLMRFFRHAENIEQPADGLHLVVGLGNPGESYRRTRHNVGAMVAQRFAERHGLAFKGSKHHADVARGTVAGVQVLLALPLTYMNESGYAVRRLVTYYRIPPERLTAVCDDLDLPFGRLRIRPDGSSGGQRGLKSIADEIGSEAFTRLRLGIGRPSIPARAYVLQRFTPEEEECLPALLDVACNALEAILSAGPATAMNDFNRDWLPALR